MVASRRRVSYPCKIIATKNHGFPSEIYNGHIRGVCDARRWEIRGGVLNIFSFLSSPFFPHFFFFFLFFISLFQRRPNWPAPSFHWKRVPRYAEDHIFSLFAFWSPINATETPGDCPRCYLRLSRAIYFAEFRFLYAWVEKYVWTPRRGTERETGTIVWQIRVFISVFRIDLRQYINSDNYGAFLFLSSILQGGRNKELQADFIILLIKCGGSFYCL